MFIKSLELFFNRLLPSVLLYDVEKKFLPQVKSLEKPFVSIFGIEHLLRLLIHVPEIIEDSSIDSLSYSFLVDNTNDLLAFCQLRYEANPEIVEYRILAVPESSVSNESNLVAPVSSEDTNKMDVNAH